MELPIPTHLASYFTSIGDENNEYEVAGVIHCDCMCEKFEVWESNDRQIIKLICKKCGKEIEVFDAGKHGWNGYVCKDDFLDRSLQLEKYVCPKCNHDAFKVSISISSQGKQDFIDECVSNDDSFSEDDWVNGFEWMGISLSCANCSNEEVDWADLETM